MSRQCWSYDQHLVIGGGNVISIFVVVGHKTNNGCLPSASVVGHKTNNGGQRNSTRVGVLKLSVLERLKILSLRFDC